MQEWRFWLMCVLLSVLFGYGVSLFLFGCAARVELLDGAVKMRNDQGWSLEFEGDSELEAGSDERDE